VVTDRKVYIPLINPFFMKRALYSLADDEFATLLQRVNDCFRRSPLNYTIVGGVAVQAHISNWLCKKYGCDLHRLAESPDFRVQDYLRATDDVDITVDPRKVNGGKIEVAKEIVALEDKIVGDKIHMSLSGNNLVSIALERKGVKRPIFKLGLNMDQNDKQYGQSADAVSFNLYQGPDDTNDGWSHEMREFERRYYFEFIDRAQKLEIPYCDENKLVVVVKNPEDLLATKIARGREKDWQDILTLYNHSVQAGMPINLEKVRQLLLLEDSITHNPNPILEERFEKFAKVIDLPKKSK